MSRNRLKLSTIEHNSTALKGYLNNPGWYAYGHRIHMKQTKRLELRENRDHENFIGKKGYNGS